MKYIKTFESLNKEEVKIGDYIQIIIDGTDHTDPLFTAFIDFMLNNIGIVINKFNKLNIDNDVRVRYDDVPEGIRSYFDYTHVFSDTYYSKRMDLNYVDDYIIGETPAEVKIKMKANKFNL